MSQKDLVEKADELSRQRPLVTAYFAVLFVVVSVFSRPVFFENADPTVRRNADWWGYIAIMLLVILGTGPASLRRPRLRALMNDEVWRANRATAVSVGYWTAMVVAFGIYLVPALHGLSAREAVFVIVTPSLALALLTLAYLERRAHRGA